MRGASAAAAALAAAAATATCVTAAGGCGASGCGSSTASAATAMGGKAVRGPRVRLGGRLLSPKEAERHLLAMTGAAAAAAAAATAATKAAACCSTDIGAGAGDLARSASTASLTVHISTASHAARHPGSALPSPAGGLQLLPAYSQELLLLPTPGGWPTANTIPTATQVNDDYACARSHRHQLSGFGAVLCNSRDGGGSCSPAAAAGSAAGSCGAGSGDLAAAAAAAASEDDLMASGSGGVLCAPLRRTPVGSASSHGGSLNSSSVICSATVPPLLQARQSPEDASPCSVMGGPGCRWPPAACGAFAAAAPDGHRSREEAELAALLGRGAPAADVSGAQGGTHPCVASALGGLQQGGAVALPAQHLHSTGLPLWRSAFGSGPTAAAAAAAAQPVPIRPLARRGAAGVPQAPASSAPPGGDAAAARLRQVAQQLAAKRLGSDSLGAPPAAAPAAVAAAGIMSTLATSAPAGSVFAVDDILPSMQDLLCDVL